MNPEVHEIEVFRVGAHGPGDAGASGRDVAATEEPLEIRLGGRPFVVIMRTPGSDLNLAAGFLRSEQIVRAAGDVTTMRYCQEEDGRDSANILNVWLNGAAAARAQVALEGRRHVTANSACGVCGRRSIDDLLQDTSSVESAMAVPRSVIETLPITLRAVQRTFEQTGGLHAAGLFDRVGTLVGIAEDVGRHNAVDKVLGAELMAGRSQLSDRLLFVSGRTSFEIVQKAVVSGVPIIASVSAPSSLAIELARQANVSLLGFVRGRTFNIYSGGDRIVL